MDFPRRSDERTPLSQINVTPLVDVMLVLLIIFMVTASIGNDGITVHLPKAQAAALSADQTLTVSLAANSQVYINSQEVRLDNLTAVLQAIPGLAKKTVFLKADAQVSYGNFVQVVSRIRAAGVDKLGMLTQPPGTGQ